MTVSQLDYEYVRDISLKMIETFHLKMASFYRPEASKSPPESSNFEFFLMLFWQVFSYPLVFEKS